MIELILFLKPICDMFWQYKLITLAIILFSFWILYSALKTVKIDVVNILIFWMIFESIITLSHNCNKENIIIFLKVLSNLVILILSRSLYDKEKKISNILMYSFFVVFCVNIFIILIGKGQVLWGNSLTLKGIYFFKTDFALAMAQIFVFARYLPKEKQKLRRIIMYIACPILIILSNARAYLIILLVLFACVLLEFLENNRLIKSFKINIITIAMGVLLIFSSLYIVSFLGTTELFKSLNLISFNMNDENGGLMSGSNTQGRDIIWDGVLKEVSKQPIKNKILGIDYASDNQLNYLKVDAHNTYLKVLYSFGYLGCLLYGILIIVSIININNEFDKKLKYTFIMFFTMYLISGLSYSNIVHTQQTWIFFIYLGMITRYGKTSKEKENEYIGNDSNL